VRIAPLRKVHTSDINSYPHLPANFSDFIFLADSLTYAENRQNRGLTRLAKIEEQVSKLCWWGRPAWPTPM
jgi:hypothetical protein